MKNRTLKFATAVLIITVIALGFICSTAFTCGPHVFRGSMLYDFHMAEFRDEEHGAYFLKAERGNSAYGYITDSNGETVEVLFEADYDDVLSATPLNRSEEPAWFCADMVFNGGKLTLTCTVREDFETKNIDFTELVFTVSEITESALRPYDLLSASWSDDNDVFNLAIMLNSYAGRACTLRCYLLDGGNVVYGTYDFVWRDGGFEIFDGEECVASGEYDFDYKNFAVYLTFDEDSLFGENKPFSSYPTLMLKTDWAYYNVN